MSALINECKNRGIGFSINVQEDVREFAKKFDIEERMLKTGFSYYPKDVPEKGNRIFKIGYTSNKDRFFLELNIDFNYSDIIENQEHMLILSDDDRKNLHAGGVKACYLSDNIELAKKLIETSIKSI
ncbi:hypothetical protein [Tepidibacter hydrothermalis]|uniref:Uncharacterized protein n=1 Tax=Tepidibacter hydrothermalis TaxID=3036126 RepID=A0ABY8E7A0_9FIRM|nr:hypothetical protein [Tepidibacter hydrothermalis]WFD08765.1 hypothetical protein P4S50_10180 [Tepidibacter hydrothermalis]